MKKAISTPLIATVAVLALVALVVIFVRMTGDPAPTVANVPDYTKMSKEEISAAFLKGKAAEAEALKGKR